MARLLPPGSVALEVVARQVGVGTPEGWREDVVLSLTKDGVHFHSDAIKTVSFHVEVLDTSLKHNSAG